MFPCFRKWTSSQCNTTIEYWYDAREKKGVIKIVKEYGQNCQKCNKLAVPRFDLEATDKAMVKIVSRMKKVFYNEAPPANEHSDLHSQFTERKKPHDSSRCQACKEGKCSQASGFDQPGWNHSHPRTPRTYYGPKVNIGWKVILQRKNLTIHPNDQ